MDSRANNAEPRVSKELEENAQEEELHFKSIVHAYSFYYKYSDLWIQTLERNIDSLSPEDLKLLPHLPDKIRNIRACTKVNFHFISALIQDDEIFQNRDMKENVAQGKSVDKPASAEDMDKVKSVLRQFVRDWSTLGEKERGLCYGAILETLVQRFPKKESRNSIRICTPGCGLGRLTYELAREGFSSQGNEFSYFMLIASHWVLNKSQSVGQYSIFPNVHTTSNLWKVQDQLIEVSIPDVVPSQHLDETADFSMSAGDFLEIYQEDFETWDCVACCFFIDTAKNILAYLRQIYQMLKKGGLFLNYGPLLYHFEGEAKTIELSYEEIKDVMTKIGFKIVEEKLHQESRYTSSYESMFRIVYDCVYFVAIKE